MTQLSDKCNLINKPPKNGVIDNPLNSLSVVINPPMTSPVKLEPRDKTIADVIDDELIQIRKQIIELIGKYKS